MHDAAGIAAHFANSLDHSRAETAPYRHWLLHDALPPETCAAIDALPYAPPPIGDTLGRRETNNSTRLFFGAAARAQHAICNQLALALQSDAVVQRIESICGIDLTGFFLRIEYCLDTDGFWLEPHTDIGVKRFTMLIYLSDDTGSEAWGTDICAPDGSLIATTPFVRNGGLIFIPATDTWHGFHRRKIEGVRRSLIVNYVGNEWRARHELAFPEAAIREAVLF
jgi:hypothetical protein